MKLVFLDTETTDKVPGNICQLTYIIHDTLAEQDKRVTSKNFFFCVDYVAKGAYDTHGFDVETLRELSKGMKFGDLYEQFKDDLFNCDFIIGHNINFDICFLKKEFSNLELEYEPKNIFCSMNYFRNIFNLKNSFGGPKPPKLSELVDNLKISEEQILESTEKFFSNSSSFHDARFDTTALYLAIIKALNLNIINKGYFSSKIAN